MTFLRGEAGLLGDVPKGIVGFERGRALRQDPAQIRYEVPGLLDPVEDLR